MNSHTADAPMATEPLEHSELTSESLPQVLPQSPKASTLEVIRQWLVANKERLLKFASVGATGVLVNLVIFEVCFYYVLVDVMPEELLFIASNGLGFLVSVFTNFLLNDFWTWGDRVKGTRRRDWLKRV